MATEAQIAHCRRIAQSGGFATLERYGPEHMSRIGKIGFQVACATNSRATIIGYMKGKGWKGPRVSTFEQDREIWS